MLLSNSRGLIFSKNFVLTSPPISNYFFESFMRWSNCKEIRGESDNPQQESTFVETDGELKKGFFGADILVTEAKTSGKCSLGTCVLLQDPSTWGEENKCKLEIFQVKPCTLFYFRERCGDSSSQVSRWRLFWTFSIWNPFEKFLERKNDTSLPL